MKDKSDKIDKLIDMEDKVENQFTKIANFIHKKKIILQMPNKIYLFSFF